MGASEWVAIGLFVAGGIVGAIGWLLIRVIGNLDKTIEKLNDNQDKQEDVLTAMQEKIIDNDKRIFAIELIHNIKGCVNNVEDKAV